MSEDAVGREAPMWFQKCVAGECGNSVGADMVWFYMVTPPTMAGVKNLLINNGTGSRSVFRCLFFAFSKFGGEFVLELRTGNIVWWFKKKLYVPVFI